MEDVVFLTDCDFDRVTLTESNSDVYVDSALLRSSAAMVLRMYVNLYVGGPEPDLGNQSSLWGSENWNFHGQFAD